MSQLNDYHETLTKCLEMRESFVVATLANTEGHVPQTIGARCIVTTAGLYWGSIGGGRLEAAVIAQSIERLTGLQSHVNQGLDSKVETSWFQTFDLQRDLGMVCGGKASVLYELHNCDTFEIIVFGAGHVAQALVPVLLNLCDKITVIDPRQEWLNRFPIHKKIACIASAPPESHVSEISQRAYVICMTQGHATDLPIVKAILKNWLPPYLGVIGSKIKARTLKAALLQDHILEERITGITCPIGLDIASQNPHDIAIAIAAQVLLKRYGTKANHS